MARICLSAPNTLGYPAGGHVWVFLNWALGFRSLGHQVVWLDLINPDDPQDLVRQMLSTLRQRLSAFGLDQCIALATPDGRAISNEQSLGLIPLEDALTCDLLCDHRYDLPAAIVERFSHSMLIDIDPGQFQIALELGTYQPAPHTHYFTVGEWVKFPDSSAVKPMGFEWQYTPPPVALEAWSVCNPQIDAAMTTVSGWYMANEWMPDDTGNWYDNSKRAGFTDYLHLPRNSPLPLELCINIGSYQQEVDDLQRLGWRVRHSNSVEDPQVYRSYVQRSLGEFSCAKPAYVRMNTGWLSDRTACYLASGKPVVIQKTGPSDLFADDLGICRFETPDQAIRLLEQVKSDYPTHCLAARQIAETHLDAKKVLTRVLEQTL